ncbi:discoidin domain-containing protein [Spirosoma oryzicola]|uniref:discoidin domain-containing protein n=1 Tax=Spirosoma oryzicola TaxID=2898794 RepID=UPI001E59E389|nr:discoidin domain-containing protein [Spirosoma oryzicola]UHG90123.1 discoidin domain-containing protein [Spirosoma oryzicola]
MAWYDQLISDLKAFATAVVTDVNSLRPRLLPAGGTAGQVLAKSSSTDYATGWVTPASGGVAFTTVFNYPALVALGTPSTLTFVLVSQDNKTNTFNANYLLWPNGVRRLLTSTSDNAPIDYSSMGSVIHDGGGVFSGDTTRTPDKVFDGNAQTFYDAANGDAGKYVGRNLVAPKTLNKISFIPRPDSYYGTKINTGQFQYSTDGASWTTVYTVSGVDSNNYTQTFSFTFAPVTAQYWRLYWPGTESFGNVAEIQLLYSY